MAKIIPFSDFVRAKKQAAPHGYIGFDKMQKCMDMLYTQAGLLDELSRYAEEILREMDLNPEKFALSPDSADEYLKLNFREFAEGNEDVYVSFDSHDGDTQYTLEVTATCTDQQSIEFDGTLFRKSTRGSEVYDTNTDSWCECPEQ